MPVLILFKETSFMLAACRSKRCAERLWWWKIGSSRDAMFQIRMPFKPHHLERDRAFDRLDGIQIVSVDTPQLLSSKLMATLREFRCFSIHDGLS